MFEQFPVEINSTMKELNNYNDAKTGKKEQAEHTKLNEERRD
jgi:hypothetical protein